MIRVAAFVAAASMLSVAIMPAQAAGGQTSTTEKAPKTAKVKKAKRGAKPQTQQAGTSAGDSATPTNGAPGTVGRAIPVAAAHSNFFATPLGILTAVGAGGGAVAGTAAALSAKGAASSSQ